MAQLGGKPRPLEPDAMRAYEMTVAAQVAEEERSRQATEPGLCLCPYLCCFWLQQATAVLTELPVRVACHACCLCGSVACKAEAITKHHSEMLDGYHGLASLLCQNLLSPCAPVSLHFAEVSLTRPEKPSAESASSCCALCLDDNPCEGCCSGCCADTVELIVAVGARRLRALLCILGGVDACHPAICCGPTRACGSEELVLNRWAADFQAAKLERTVRFYARAEAEPQRYTFFYNETGALTVAINGKSQRERCCGRGRDAKPPVALKVERDAPPTGLLNVDPAVKKRTGGAHVVQGLRPIGTRFATPPNMRPLVDAALASKASAGSSTTRQPAPGGAPAGAGGLKPAAKAAAPRPASGGVAMAAQPGPASNEDAIVWHDASPVWLCHPAKNSPAPGTPME